MKMHKKRVKIRQSSLLLFRRGKASFQKLHKTKHALIGFSLVIIETERCLATKFSNISLTTTEYSKLLITGK